MIPPGERPLKVVIAENVEKYRLEQGLSKRELAALANYSYSSYHQLISGRVEVRLTKLQEFAFVLGVKSIDLIEDWQE